MNLLHLLGEYRRPAALVALMLAAAVLAALAVARWRPAPHPTAARTPPAATPSAPSPSPTGPAASPPPAAAAEATAIAFCRQYFAASWQESASQEQARVAPYLTTQALAGWRDQLTAAQVSAHQTESVTACTATDEGPAPGNQRGYFLDAQVVTTSTAGSQTATAAAEVFLVPAGGVWKVDQVRT